jgi:hypothetical protein
VKVIFTSARLCWNKSYLIFFMTLLFNLNLVNNNDLLSFYGNRGWKGYYLSTSYLRFMANISAELYRLELYALWCSLGLSINNRYNLRFSCYQGSYQLVCSFLMKNENNIKY